MSEADATAKERALREALEVAERERDELRERLIIGSLHIGGVSLTDAEKAMIPQVHFKNLVSNGWSEAEAKEMVETRQRNEESRRRERERDMARREAIDDSLRGYGGHYGY